jgi:hypothetical protein
VVSVTGDIEIRSLSGDSTTDGKQIDIAATSSPGTTLHTAVTGTSYWDYVTIELCNRDTVARTVTLEWGGTTNADRVVLEVAPGLGAVPIVDRRMIRDGHVIRAYCDAANVVSAWGEVHRARVEV